MSTSDLLALAERLDDFNRRVANIVQAELSPSGCAIAIALLVSTTGGLFAEAAAALRARASTQTEETRI